MKLLAVFFLFGLAAASAVPLFIDDVDSNLEVIESELDNEFNAFAEEKGLMVRFRKRVEGMLDRMKKAMDEGKDLSDNVMKKLEDVFSKYQNLGGELSDKYKSILEDLRSKINKQSAEGNLLQRLRERFESLLQRVKKNFDDGRGVRGDVMKKLQDVYDKVTNMGGEFSEKIKNLFEDLRNRVSKSSVQKVDFNLQEIFRKLKKLIKDKLDADQLKAKVEELFGKGSEMAEKLIATLKEKGGKGKKKILDFIDRILGEKEEDEGEKKRSIKEVYEKVRDYFEGLGIELKEKFAKFGDFVKERYQDALDKTKNKVENVKRIAKEFLEDTRKIGKDMGEEALDFFREYKKDLGKVYDDLVEKVNNIAKND